MILKSLLFVIFALIIINFNTIKSTKVQNNEHPKFPIKQLMKWVRTWGDETHQSITLIL